MRKNEVELIAALVEGRLEDETEARALVESSAAHRAEYDAQKMAYEALSTLPPVELTELERSALRRDVWTELQARPAATPTTAPRWMRWSYAAAGLFAIVGLLVVVDQTNPDFAPTAVIGGADQDALETFEESAEAARGATDLTPAPTLTESAADAAADDGQAQAASPDSFGLFADQVRDGTLETAELGATYYSLTERAEFTPCLETAGIADHEVIGLITEIEYPPYLIVVPAGVQVDATTQVTFVDPDTCEVVYTDE